MNRAHLIGCSVLAALGGVASTQTYAADDNFTVTFRTHYGQVARDFYLPVVSDEDSEEMSFATRIDYVSDYYQDRIGFDASIYAVTKLYADKDTARLPLLDENGEGFSKIGQANIKLKLTDNMELRLGRMRIISPLMTDTDGRSEPSTREAIKGDFQLGGAKLYGIYSTGVSTSGTDQFSSYTDGDDGVLILGGRYRFDNGLGIHVAHGQLKDAKRQTFINASYSRPLGGGELAFDAYHYMAKGIGDQSNLEDAKGTDGKLDTYLSSLAVSYAYNDLTYSASYQRVGDDLYEPSWDGFNHDKSVLWTNNSVQILDFYNPNQESLQLRLDYAPSQVSGLTFMTRYTEGDYKEGTEVLTDKEFDVEAGYEIQGGWAKGLSLQLRYADVTIGGVGDLQDMRLIAQYTLSL